MAPSPVRRGAADIEEKDPEEIKRKTEERMKRHEEAMKAKAAAKAAEAQAADEKQAISPLESILYAISFDAASFFPL